MWHTFSLVLASCHQASSNGLPVFSQVITYKATTCSSCNFQALEATTAQIMGVFEAVSLAFRCSKLTAGAGDEHDRGWGFASWGKRRRERELNTDLEGVPYPVRESERPPSGYAKKPPL